MERARQFERMLVCLDASDLQAVTPQLRELDRADLLVWGTGDTFFEVSWAYWLRGTIPGTTRVVTVEGARLFFPEERPRPGFRTAPGTALGCGNGGPVVTSRAHDQPEPRDGSRAASDRPAGGARPPGRTGAAGRDQGRLGPAAVRCASSFR